MVLTIIFGIIAAVCLVSSLIFYVFMRPQNNLNSSNNEKQQIIHSLRPSIDIIIKKLDEELPFRLSTSSNKTNRSSTPVDHYETNELIHKKQHRSAGSIFPPITQTRSPSLATGLFPTHRPRSIHRRQGSIVDPNQLALIQFTLPPTNNNNKYRRRSVAICNSINETKENSITIRDPTLPCLLSFSITYLTNSQLKVQFNSLQSLPSAIHLQQLTIKVKLTPDGKEKSLCIKKMIMNEATFGDENFILFSNIQFEKHNDRILLMTVNGKDLHKKTIHLGQIGKIHFNQINKFEKENRIDFIHEVEKMKPSSVELLIALRKKDDQHIHVDLSRIKGLKIDQKKLDAKCYVKILLLDRHRILSTKITKFYSLNSSNFNIAEQFDFNILTFDSNNLDRLMFMFSLYSNSNPANEYKCIARVKLASASFCSGSGTIHWQQFKLRESFSMWHTLNKEQH
ncbi:unnamed protein product [Adineta steineri]|uniref:Uncharacterized protein n=1 Tax=Adineta steineri TaxID=433720 RepID=A0A819PVK2_9BILA|nr:unnamed protein product [Adineta steineri]CAF4015145.1 unnamed protein product [Adineta steineri]